MEASSLLSPAARGLSSLARIFVLLGFVAPLAGAVTYNAIPSPNLDLSNLGQTALVGDYSGISLYQYEGQSENGFNTNGSQSVLSQFPNGDYATLASADAGIQAMCSFIMHDGTMAGIVVGGNFTSLGGIESQGAALLNPDTGSITPLTGLSGQVDALLCDEDTNTVYVGGSFKGANSTNAIAWVGTAGWTNLPFAGFNGPVTSISKAPDGNIIFGGTFTGLGNASAPSQPDQQVINISSGNITSGSSSTSDGFSDPSNIICPDGSGGSGNTWLLADSTPGFWNASFSYGFVPTKLRLYNTFQDGRGTKTFRYTAAPYSGIMNLTYIDPTTGQNLSCTSECPLSSNSSIEYQDFYFVNVLGMDGFQIDISAWYGAGGGLNGVELYENDIFAYAINDFNEPTCASISTASTASNTGPWTVSPSLGSSSEFLTASLTTTPVDSGSASVTFQPDIKDSGNYSVNLYTPGCVQDNSCTSRGQVNITGIMSTGSTEASFEVDIWQTNDYDKYDQIYFGYIEANSDSFRPSVILSPSASSITNQTVVAQRVGFTLISGAGGLNSLFEYNPSEAMVDTSEFANSTVDQAGVSLGNGAGVKALASSDNVTYVGGNFSTDAYDNIFMVTTTDSVALTSGGLNDEVMSLFLNGTLLYAGGNFTNTSKADTPGLNNVALYDTSAKSWKTLGAGVSGRTFDIVPLSMNVTSDQPELVITFTGDFDHILAFDSYSAITVSGFAIWVPSKSNWIQNIDASTMLLNGQLTASVDVPSGGTFVAGSLMSQQVSSNGAVDMGSSLTAMPIKIMPPSEQSTSSNARKRATTTGATSGVVAGLFYDDNNLNITVLGGHFSAVSTNGSTVNNLVFLNGSNSDAVTGIGSQVDTTSTFLSMVVQGTTLYAGGLVSGTVNGNDIDGLIAYDLVAADFGTQPPSLAGDNVSVNTISTNPDSGDVYVGGSFDKAGSLECPTVCSFVLDTAQWSRPGTNLEGTANAMTWASKTSLIVGGSLAISGTNVSIATYDTKKDTWTAYDSAASVPGPVTALVAANSDTTQMWVAGTATNASTFLMKYDGSNWNSVGDVFGLGSTIQGLQELSLTDSHSSSDLVPSNMVLMLTGSILLPSFGNASAVLFNGTTFTPYALTSGGADGSGSIAQMFSQKQNYFKSSGGHTSLGLVILYSLLIAAAIMSLIFFVGMMVAHQRHKRDGYQPAPTHMMDQAFNRLPPDQLLRSVKNGPGGAPMI